jgi:methylmalonyl-CoA/ethylmalonyl-CoA epimerase
MSVEQQQPASASSTLGSSILGSITEVCIVTPDLYKSADGLMRLGIGPFQVFDFNSKTVIQREYKGEAGDFELKVAFAQQGSLVFELMQPTKGPSLMAEYLAQNDGREGVQHIAFDMKELPMSERLARMKERGFRPAMQGVWKGNQGTCHFCFFDTLEATGTIFETIEFSKDWKDPEFTWYPYPRPHMQ